jgi:hypothetical protein
MQPPETTKAAPACAERDPRIEQASRPLELSNNERGSVRQGVAGPPSPEALAVADDLTFEAIAQACARVIDYFEHAYEAAQARDSRTLAKSFRQAILTLRAACEVVEMLSEGAP